MAYSDVVLQDAPFNYVRFNNTVAESGSHTEGAYTPQNITYGGGIGNSEGVSGGFFSNNSVVTKAMVGDGLFTNSSGWSMEAWIKRGDTTGRTWQNIILREEGSNKVLIRIDDSTSTNANKITAVYKNASVTTTLVGPVITNTNWNHIVLTSVAFGTLILYVNGVEVARGAGPSNNVTFGSSPVYLGAYGTGTANENFYGYMDEVATYKSTLTPARVLAHYNSAANVSNQSPVMSLTLNTPQVNVKIPYAPQAVSMTADRLSNGSGTATTAQALRQSASTYRRVYSTFPFPALPPNANDPLEYATYRFYIDNLKNSSAVDVTSIVVTLAPLTAAVSESGTSVLAQASTPTIEFTVTSGWNMVDISPFFTYWKTNTFNGMSMTVTTNDRNFIYYFRESANPPSITTKYANSTQTYGIYDPQPSYATADRLASGSGTATSLVGAGGGGQPSTYIKFGNLPKPTGNYTINQALLKVYGLANNSAGRFTINRITQDWAEGDTTTVTSVDSGLGNFYVTPNQYISINIASIFESWKTEPNYGIELVPFTGTYSVASRESVSPPTLQVDYDEFVGTPARVQAPVMTATLNMPQHRVGSGTKQTVPAMSTLALSSITPVVKTTKAVFINAPVFNSNMTFTGGEVKLRDQTQKTTAMVAYLTSPNAKVILGKDAKNTAPVMNAGTLSAVAPKVDNKTSTRVFVLGAMSASLRFPSNIAINGKRGDDRYTTYIPQTTDADDMWLKLDELSGTVAYDSTGTGTAQRANGTYVGPVQFNVNGPYDRRAVRFNGNTSYLAIDYTNFSDVSRPDVPFFSDGTDITIEFSIKTSQANGVLWTTRGSKSSATLKNGFIELVDENNVLYRVRKNIADNQWHHIVISMPKTIVSGQFSDQRPMFVQIDGVVEYRRYEGIVYLGNQLAPVQFMKLQADAKDLIIRRNYALPERVAAKTYYEWSNALIVNPEPMTLSLNAVDPKRARGNIKKVLLVHGLPWFINNQGGYLHNYRSLFANYYVNTRNASTSSGPGGLEWTYDQFGNAVNPATSSGVSTIGALNVFYDVAPFKVDEMFYYPVGITGKVDRSSPGLLNNDYRDGAGQFTDDKTGLPRFIDVNSDLEADLDDFDILTVMNYPAPAPYAARDSFYPRQPDLGLSNIEWAQAREQFRDNILKAVNKGINLWVNEPEFAQHIGLISGYDVHTPDAWPEIYQPGNRNLNRAGYELDKSKLLPGTQMIRQGETGDYFSRPQANRFRRIVATEPGLTDIPSWTIGRKIEHYTYDPYVSNGYTIAYEVNDHTKGLKIGDKVPMSLDIENRTANNNSFTYLGEQWRDQVVSARPDGVAGKVIAREDLAYNQPDTLALKANPWRNNVTTIAAEKGTVLRGQAIGGRIFMELMDMDLRDYGIYVDTNKNKWRGDDLNYQTSFWDFDLRRYQEILVTILVQKFRFDSASGTFTTANTRQDILNIEPGLYTILPHYSMNARGLRWLAAADSVPAGDVKAYAPSMEINVSMGDANIRRTRNISTKVTGAMRTDLEMRNTANYKANNVRNKALPMVLNLEMRGFGKVVSIPPMEVTLTSPSNITANGGGDRIIVYINNDRNITTFLKENN